MSVSLRLASGHDVLGLRDRARSAAGGRSRRPACCRSMWKEKLRPSPTWPNPLACTPVEMSSIANSWLPKSRSAARVMTEPYRWRRRRRDAARDERPVIATSGLPTLAVRSAIQFARSESYPLPRASNPQSAVSLLRRCAGNRCWCRRAARRIPPTPRRRRSFPLRRRCLPRSPARQPAWCGRWRACSGGGVRRGDAVRWRCSARAVGGQSVVTRLPPAGPPRTVPLPGAGDGDGRRRRRHGCTSSTRGGYFRVDLRGRHRRPGSTSTGQQRHRLHRDRPPRRRQAGARQRRRRGVHTELRHRRRRLAADLRPGGCPCRTREYGRRAGPRPDVGDHRRRRRHRRRARAAGRRGRDHDGGRLRRAGCWSPTPAATSCWCSAPTR